MLVFVIKKLTDVLHGRGLASRGRTWIGLGFAMVFANVRADGYILASWIVLGFVIKKLTDQLHGRGLASRGRTSGRSWVELCTMTAISMLVLAAHLSWLAGLHTSYKTCQAVAGIMWWSAQPLSLFASFHS